MHARWHGCDTQALTCRLLSTNTWQCIKDHWKLNKCPGVLYPAIMLWRNLRMIPPNTWQWVCLHKISQYHCNNSARHLSLLDEQPRQRDWQIHQGSRLHLFQIGDYRNDCRPGFPLPLHWYFWPSWRAVCQIWQDRMQGTTHRMVVVLVSFMSPSTLLRILSMDCIALSTRMRAWSKLWGFFRANADETMDRWLDGRDAMTPRQPEVEKNLSLKSGGSCGTSYIYHFWEEAQCPLSYICQANRVQDFKYDNLDELD